MKSARATQLSPAKEALLEARLKGRGGAGSAEPYRPTVEIQPYGAGPVLFFVHPNQSTMLTLRHFTGPLGTQQRVTGLLPERDGDSFAPSRTIEELAVPMLAALRSTQAEGPYVLAGYSLGGLLAYELAGRLIDEGEEVTWLGLLDSAFGSALYKPALWRDSPVGFWRRLQRLGPRNVMRLGAIKGWRRIKAPRERQYRDDVLLGARYLPRGHTAPLALFTSSRWVKATGSDTLGWERVHRGRTTACAFRSEHLSMITEPLVDSVATALADSLRRTIAVGRPLDP